VASVENSPATHSPMMGLCIQSPANRVNADKLSVQPPVATLLTFSGPLFIRRTEISRASLIAPLSTIPCSARAKKKYSNSEASRSEPYEASLGFVRESNCRDS
jgi:hypothetical protein